MEIATSQLKRVDIVKVVGRIDSYSAPQLEEALKNIVDQGRFRIVVDMTEVDFISSKGWWVLIETQKSCKRYNRGEVILVNIQDKIRESLDLVGMGSYFNIYDDITLAVGSV